MKLAIVLQHKKASIIIMTFLLALMTTVALLFSPDIRQTVRTLRTTAIVILITLWLFYYYVFTKIKPIRCSSIIVASIFLALLQVLGLIERYTGSVSFIDGNKYKATYSFVLFIGYAVLIYSAFLAFINWVMHQRASLSKSKNNRLTTWFRNKTLLKSMIFILICWLPIIITYYPGVSTFDGMRQINQVFDPAQLNNHHPILTTFIMGGLVKVGRLLAGNNFGLFLAVIYQVFLVSFCFACSISYLNRCKCSVYLQLGLLLFYACMPLWSIVTVMVMKDVSYFAIFLLYTIKLIDFRATEKHRWRDYFLLLLLALLLCFIRKDGLYVVFVSLLVLGFSYRHQMRRRLLSSLVLMMIFVTTVNSILLPKIGIPNGYGNSETREMLSIPFQATARYVKYAGGDVTPAERKAINAVLDYDSIGNRYQATISDQVKETYRLSTTKQDLLTYFQTWFVMAMKHPVVYLDAIIAQTGGYYTVTDSLTADVAGDVRQFDPRTKKWADDRLTFSFADSMQRERELANKLRRIYRYVPLLGELEGGAFYFWLIVLAFLLLLIDKRKQKYVYLSTVATHMLIALLSPVGGSLRYLLPIIATLPFVFILCLVAQGGRHQEGQVSSS
ncbi:MAG: DUF6020 family protein [Sporolactobacillus sp.]|jgi:hypothetical protein|nr:DUF6020 family protein [Sporolactobacillus sp.]